MHFSVEKFPDVFAAAVVVVVVVVVVLKYFKLPLLLFLSENNIVLSSISERL